MRIPFGNLGFPRRSRGGTCVAKDGSMLNPAVLDCLHTKADHAEFWLRLLNNEALQDCDDLEKLVIGCEIIAALDAVDLLAA